MRTAKVPVRFRGPGLAGQIIDHSLHLDGFPEPDAEGSVLTLTADEEFLESVGAALAEPGQLRLVTNAAQILAATQSGRPAVLIIDAAVGLSRLANFIENLQKARPQLAIFIAGERTDSSALIKLVATGRVFRLLFKPLAPGLTRLAIEAALHRLPRPERDAEARLEPDFGLRRLADRGLTILYRWRHWAMVAAGLVAALWWLMGDHEPASLESLERRAETVVETRPEPPAASQPVEAPSPVDRLLEQARVAFEAGRYASPEDASALRYYLDILQIDPNHTAAQDGVTQIADLMLTRAAQALLGAERVDLAREVLGVARQLQPTDAALAFFEAQVLQEQQRTLIGQALGAAARGDITEAAEILARASPVGAADSEELTLARDKIGRLQTEKRIESALQHADQRLSEGRLVQPAGDNAKFYFNSVLGVDEDNAASLLGLQNVAEQLIASARESMSEGDFETAQQWLYEAEQLGIDVPTLASAERELRDATARSAEAARRQANLQLLDLGRQRLDEGRLVEPRTDSAKHYLLALRGEEPDNADLRGNLDRLATQLTQRARQALRAEEYDAAQRWIDEALELAVGQDVLRALQSELDIAREIAALWPRVPEGRLVRREEFEPPEYPVTARLMGVEGRVRAEFTVSARGEVEDIVVTEAVPKGIFDKVAVRALEKWRYEPTMVGGQAIERRAYVVIRFSIEE